MDMSIVSVCSDKYETFFFFLKHGTVVVTIVLNRLVPFSVTLTIILVQRSMELPELLW